MSTSSVISEPEEEKKTGILKGIVTGLLPLALLIVIILVTFIIVGQIRQTGIPSEPLLRQRPMRITLILGCLLAIVAYIIAICRVLRRIRFWQQNNAPGSAIAALCMLGVTALIVALPVILVLIFP